MRLRQNRLTDRYTYFSKVEISFPGSYRAERSEVLEAVEKFAGYAVPILAEEHWPNWSELKQNGR